MYDKPINKYWWWIELRADRAMSGPGGHASIDQNLGLVVAVRSSLVSDTGASFRLNP